MTSTTARLPLDFSRTNKPRSIQRNLIAYMRLFDTLPGMVMHDGADNFWFISGKPAPGNVILRADFPAHQAEQHIDALFEQVGQFVDEIDWMVFPSDSPADLGKRLEARGMLGTPGGNWLWADLTRLSAAPPVADGFHVELVRDDLALAEWTRLSEAGFGAGFGWFYDAYARHGYGAAAFSLHYIGYLDDVAVTSGTLLDAGGWASIYDLSTPPEFRQQGFGGALTYILMDMIRARGYSDTWIWSSDMAKALYQSLGFVAADFGMREYGWHKPVR